MHSNTLRLNSRLMNDLVRQSGHVVVPPEQVKERAGVLAFMGEQKRVGYWQVPRNFRVACAMGSTVIDLREATISAGVTTIEIFALFGSVEIVVPSGVYVELDGDAFAGEFSFDADPTMRPGPDSPTIRITGSVYFGSVEAQARLAGEEPKERKKRLRAARR